MLASKMSSKKSTASRRPRAKPDAHHCWYRVSATASPKKPGIVSVCVCVALILNKSTPLSMSKSTYKRPVVEEALFEDLTRISKRVLEKAAALAHASGAQFRLFYFTPTSDVRKYVSQLHESNYAVYFTNFLAFDAIVPSGLGQKKKILALEKEYAKLSSEFSELLNVRSTKE